MEIIKDTLEFNIIVPTVVTIGKFDGFHKGHKLIFDTMNEYRTLGYRICVMTFDKPPSSLGFGNDEGIIHTMDEKEQVFRRLDIDYLVELPFTKETAGIEAKRFIEQFLVKQMNAKAIVVGDDCTFGHKAEGTAATLVDYGPIYGYEVKVLNKLKDGDRDISSTYIRELICKREIFKANSLTYRPYFINGIFKRALTGGTSGLLKYIVNIPEGKILPDSGLFYSDVLYNEAFYPAISHVNKDERVLETYVYGGVKGIASGTVSVALWKLIPDTDDLNAITDGNPKLRQVIFEGEKWHKENPRW